MDFTIITPSRNYGRFIEECLESVAHQDGVELEHLVIDACSEDNTLELIAQYPHAKVIQEEDSGMTEAINKGFRRAQGQWVMWLNADDKLRPGALSNVMGFSRKHASSDVIYGCWNFIDTEGCFLRRMTVFPFCRGMIANLGCYIASTATFLRRVTTIEEGFFLNENFQYVMDGEYYARLASLGKKFTYCPRVLADFRLHDESLSQRYIRRKDIEGVLARQRQFAESRAIRRVYGVRLSNDEMLNGVVEGVLYHVYRIKKGILRLMYRNWCKEGHS